MRADNDVLVFVRGDALAKPLFHLRHEEPRRVTALRRQGEGQAVIGIDQVQQQHRQATEHGGACKEARNE